MVRCATSIFFDINGIDIRITSPFTITSAEESQSVCQGYETTYNLAYNKVNTDEGDVTFDVQGLPAGADYSFDPSTASDDTDVVLTIITNPDVPAGTYPLTISGTSTDNTISTDVELDILSGVTGLSPATVYYWRVQSVSPCAEQAYGTSWSFQTGGQMCDLSTEQADLSINPNDEWLGTSTITLSDTRTLAEAEVSVNIEHSYVGDLSARLIGPDGTSSCWDVPTDRPSRYTVSKVYNGRLVT